MSPFARNPTNKPQISRVLNKYPLLFGIPFISLMVGASYGLTLFTQTRYDLHDQRVSQLSKEDSLGLQRNRKKFDIREEYFRLNAASNENWEPKRIQRPEGLPEWGVAPEQVPPKEGGFKPKDS